MSYIFGHVDRVEEGGSTFKMLTGKLIGNRPIGRPRRRREYNIIMGLKEIGTNNEELLTISG